jgi:GPH family glycoside/pentoside/hexuronide:cation symporter
MSKKTSAAMLSARRKIGWGIGGAAEGWMAGGITQFTGPIYTIALKLNPAKLGLIGSLPRFLDAAYDIWLGNLSDNSRTRWGRRRPFIAIGAVLSAIFFITIGWVPLGISANWQLGYFAVFSTGYWLSFGTYAIPFNALGFELTNDYNERTSVQAHRFFSIQLAGLALSALYPLCFAKIFTRHVPAGVAPEVIGARWVSLIFGTLILVTGLAPALVSRENLINEAHRRVPLMLALRNTFGDRLFLHFMAMIIVSISGVTIASSLGLFVIVYHIFGGNRENGANLLFYSSVAITGCTLVLTTVLPAVARHIGKKGMILAGQFLILAGGLASWKLYTPAHPYWSIFPAFVMTAGMACFQILYGSFIGDICDVDELRTGARREGMYGAAATFLNKIVYASQGALNGLVLAWTGYTASFSVQTTAALTRMRIVFAVMPGLFALVGAIFAVTFPINARRAAETRRLLEERHAALGLVDESPAQSILKRPPQTRQV